MCSGGCKLCSDGLSGLCTNPLAAFVMITFVTQIPVAVASALEIGGVFNGCRQSQWLLGMLVVSIIHMVTSVYLANRIINRTDEALRDRHTSWERISYLLCHDPWIACYLCIVMFNVIWLVIGFIWRTNDDCGEDLDVRVSLVLGLGWLYLFAGPSVLSCNLCCVCCDQRDYAGDDAEFSAKEADKEARKSKRNSSANKNNNFSASADIETPNAPQQQAVPQPRAKSEPLPPRTYSVDGVPVSDDGVEDVVEAEVVIEGEKLPPPMRPPTKDGSNAQAARAKAEVVAAKAKVTAEKAAKTVSEKVGGWFNKKKKGNDGKLPERKASIY